MTYAGAEAGGPTHARRIASARGVGNARPLAPARPITFRARPPSQRRAFHARHRPPNPKDFVLTGSLPTSLFFPTGASPGRRPSAPSRGAGGSQAQAQAPRAEPQLLLHGREVPGLLQHHHRVQPLPDCRALRLLLRRALPAHRRPRAPHGGLQLPPQGGLSSHVMRALSQRVGGFRGAGRERRRAPWCEGASGSIHSRSR